MRRARAFFTALALAFGTCMLPQTADAQAQSDRAKDHLVAPNAPPETAEPSSGHGGTQQANICKELVAYLTEKATKPEAKTPAKPAADSKPVGPGQTAPPVDKTQQDAGYSAPVPQNDRRSTPAPMSVADAQQLLSANDLAGCQQAVQKMRRAGVQLPPGLLALGALRSSLLQGSEDAPPK